jgi:hypothetical protein
MCQITLSQERFEMSAKKWEQYHEGLLFLLGLFLGFYVKIMLGRWWEQIQSLPRIDDLAMIMNGSVVLRGHAHDALELKKKILRLVLLSYTLMFVSICPSMRKLYGSGEKIVQNGLENWNDAINRLKSEQGSKLGWMYKWWVPINWCCHLVEQEFSRSEAKLIIRELIQFKESLTEVADFTHNPAHAITYQSVYFVCWIYLTFGALAVQPCNATEKSEWWILQVLLFLATSSNIHFVVVVFAHL